MAFPDDSLVPGTHAPDGERRYDSFVIRIWSNPRAPDRLLRVEIQHVQSAHRQTAKNIDYAWIALVLWQYSSRSADEM